VPHHIVLTLALFKSDQIDFVIQAKLHDRFHKGLSHLCDLLGGGKAIAQMTTHEASDASLAGQLRDVGIQIHPINTLQFQHDMFALKLGNTFA
jgi:hypothetical protein